MYIKDGICYAGELVEGITITNAKPLDGGMMLVTFSTGEKRLFDTTRLNAPAYDSEGGVRLCTRRYCA